jgi:hypothetical protein
MAAGLGFKTFTTGEVLTAADTNGYLMQGVLVFASAAARSAAVTSPQQGQMSYLKDTSTIESYNGSAWVANNGKLLQVVQGTSTTATTIASTTFTDSGLSATITPSSTSSKILITYVQNVLFSRSSTAIAVKSRLLRGATAIYTPSNDLGTTGANINSPTSMEFADNIAGTYLDSPNTTSATTYKTQGCVTTTANSGTLSFQQASAISTIILMEIGA